MTVALLFQSEGAIVVQNLYLCSLIAPLIFSQHMFRNQSIEDSLNTQTEQQGDFADKSAFF